MKKGFTLTELISVIIIIGIILILVIPSITNLLNDEEETLSKVIEDVILQAGELYTQDNIAIFPETEGNIYCIKFQQLINNDYLNEELKDPVSNNDINKNQYVKVSVENGNYEYIISETCVPVDGPEDIPHIYVVSQFPKDTEYAQSKEIKVKYLSTKLSDSHYYIKVSESISLNNVISSCGTSAIPFACVDSNVKTLQPNTWYEIDDTATFTITKNMTIQAIMQNNNNYSKGIAYKETKIDTSAPEIDLAISSVKTDRATLVPNCNDPESGITKYEYSKDNGNTWIIGKNTHTFIGLTQGTEYDFVARCTNGSGLISEGLSSETTKEIIEPTVAQYSQKPNTGTFASERVIRITFDSTDIQEPKYYYSFDGNDWQQVSNSTYDVTFKEKGELYAKTEDSTGNYKISSIPYTVTNVDSSEPNVSIAVGEIQTDRATLTATCSDSESGITKYEYSKDNGSTWVSNDTTSSYTFIGLKQGTSYTFVVRCTNGSGLTKTASSTNSTISIIAPKIEFASQTIEGLEYAQSKVIRITFDGTNIVTPTYHYSTDGVDFTSTTNTIVDLTFKENGKVYAMTKDSTGNLKTASTYIVTNVDSEAPEIPTVTDKAGASTCSWKNNHSLTLSSTDNVGILHYEIDINSDGVADSTTSSNFIPLNGYSTHTARFRTVDLARNVSGWTEPWHIHMDTEKPVHTNWWWGEVTKDVARLYIQATDNAGISKVQCPTSTESGSYNNWHWFEATWDSSANAYRCDITPSTFGHYGQTYQTHLYIYDHAGNGGYYNQTSVSIPTTCAYAAGQTWDYAYNGGVQAFTVPCSGTYKLEVWGAQGGASGPYAYINHEGGLGGYSYGNQTLTIGQNLYIGVGGQGTKGEAWTVSNSNTSYYLTGGYNGGGAGLSLKNSSGDWTFGGSGGGATHIALGTNRGVLANYSSYTSEILIVAGGGGGSSDRAGWNDDGSSVEGYTVGGTGGGTTGGDPSIGSGSYFATNVGGTQTGKGSLVGDDGTGFGQGGGAGMSANGGCNAAGGGGGWYGGGCGYAVYGSGGGSGYIGGVTGGSTSNGVQEGNGYARITLVSISN